jgi:hypothetical protein
MVEYWKFINSKIERNTEIAYAKGVTPSPTMSCYGGARNTDIGLI